MAVTSRVVRSVSCAAIIGLSLGVSAPGALAQGTEGASQVAPENAVNKANIDFNKQGSITLYKKKGAESDKAATGQKMEDVPGEALEGVTYKITKLDYNLQTDNWADFPQTVADIPAGKKTGPTKESTTGQDGKAEFKNLALGLYLVEETEAPDGIVAGAPFIVSVPMVNEASNAWNYDVVAYPKNTETTTEKTVEDVDRNIQDEYTYTINADAPTWRGESKLEKFEFTDTLDPRLEFQKVTEVKAGETALDAGDYAVTQPSPDNGNTLTVSLTEEGLAKVNSGAKMSLTFGVKRKEVGDTTELENEGQVIFRNPNTGGDVKNKTNKVVTYHGKLKVVKKDGEEANRVLQGAEFELYKCTSAAVLGDKLTVKGAEKWTTGEDGTVTIDGLHVTDFADNKEVTDIKKFCLKETKAPAGYALPENTVTEIDFKREDIKQTNEANGDDAVTLVSEIDNIKRDTPNLPMTGGAGVGILAAIGAAIVAAGVWFARRSAKN